VAYEVAERMQALPCYSALSEPNCAPAIVLPFGLIGAPGDTIGAPPFQKNAKMAEPVFSVEHRQQFRELSAVGELHAINLSLEQLDFGPWSLGYDIDNHDTADRLKSRFRAAVRKAAIAAYLRLLTPVYQVRSSRTS
jgi:hypothetical protein